MIPVGGEVTMQKEGMVMLIKSSPLAEEDAATAGLEDEGQLRQHFIGEVRAGRLKIFISETIA